MKKDGNFRRGLARVTQGMHEVLAPFVALSDPELPTSDISLSYGAFIKRFLPYAFNKDEEFISLQVGVGCGSSGPLLGV